MQKWILPATLIILVSILFIPAAIPGFDPMMSPRLLLITLGLMLMALGSLWRVDKALCIFAAYLCIWMVGGRFNSLDFYSYFLPALLALLAIPYLASIDEDGQIKVLKAIVAMAVIQSTMVVCQKIGWLIPPIKFGGHVWYLFYPLYDAQIPASQHLGIAQGLWAHGVPFFKAPAQGFTGGTNPLSFLLAMGAVSSLGVGWFWPVLIIIPALLLTNALGGIVAGFLGIAYLLYMVMGNPWMEWTLKSRNVFIVIMTILALALLVSFQIHGWTDSNRLSVWSTTIRAFVHDPSLQPNIPATWHRNVITGWGPGGFSSYFPPLFQKSTSVAGGMPWNQAHNEYLQLLIEYGLIGFGMMIYFLTGVGKKFLHRPRNLIEITINAGVLILAVNAFFFHPLQMAETGIVALCFASFFLGRR